MKRPARNNIWHDSPMRKAKCTSAAFYAKYRGQTPDQALETVTARHHADAVCAPPSSIDLSGLEAGLDQFTAFLQTHFPKARWSRKIRPTSMKNMVRTSSISSDRGYLAHVHPLELWMLHYRERHPSAHLKEIWAKSANERQDVYWWLFKTSHVGAQNNRIHTLLEQDAFKEIYKAWKRQGYPFDSLVPSYATTIGVSGDTPAALAELVGIDHARRRSLPI